MDAVKDAHAGSENDGKSKEFPKAGAGAPVVQKPFGQPYHTRRGHHHKKDILPHAKGKPGKKQGRNIPF